MAEETLLTAARRVCRFFNIDMNKGGLITTDTQQAVETLAKMVEKQDRTDRGEPTTVPPRQQS